MINTSAICNLIDRYPENWEEICEKLHIVVVKEGNLALFKYKVDADFFNPIVKEARGIIIDLNTLEVVCWSFDKFFNHGEPYADQIDWSTAKVQEKVDGSIMKLWNYKGEWRLSTNGTIDAFEAENAEGYNFGRMTKDAMESQGLSLKTLDPDYTYIFELVSPNNQIIVQYDKTMVYHIGTRNNHTGQEVEVNIGIQKPKQYNLSSLAECIAFANTFKGTDAEGFVVVDAVYHRVKVKSEDWVRLHHLSGNNMLSLSKALELITSGEVKEYLVYFPHKKDFIDKILYAMAKEKNEIKREILLLEDKDRNPLLSRKDFALRYSHHPHFKFYIQVIYENKPLFIDNKYWEKFLKGVNKE